MPRQAELNVALHPTLTEEGEGLLILDQTRLPHAAAMVRLQTAEEAAHAIRSMQVRGAPLIGVTAAYGVALGLRTDASDSRLAQVVAMLAATRPTAVNLHWALARMQRVLQKSAPATRQEASWREARAIAAEDAAANAAIGLHGLPLIAAIHAGLGYRMDYPPSPLSRKGSDHVRQASPVHGKGLEVVNIMTHCNAGRLATVAHGTALAPIYAAHATGIPVHVWVSETRPRNQGLLTAWELAEAGVPHTLIADNAAGLLMMQGKVDMVIVGADRIAANGDTANKIGTYLKALAARAHDVPFYVAAPMSSIDFACPEGGAIPIEERAAAELDAGGTPAANPAFDVTPACLITGILSECGVANAAELAQWKS